MLVVADSSPLIVLVEIGQIDILPRLFTQVVIPPAVARELRSALRPGHINRYFATEPKWLTIRQPAVVRPIARLHVGETEALSLALELHADVVLVDERKAYREAVAMRLNAIGTVGALERAAEVGLLDLKDAFDRLKQTDFWIAHALLDERLKLHISRKQR